MYTRGDPIGRTQLVECKGEADVVEGDNEFFQAASESLRALVSQSISFCLSSSNIPSIRYRCYVPRV
jgi:hypothetical protein